MIMIMWVNPVQFIESDGIHIKIINSQPGSKISLTFKGRGGTTPTLLLVAILIPKFSIFFKLSGIENP